ncbi:unnamed protein product [Ambrosiozyma monospora]|uniref:Unnamed protein product n=1 Tax=Ambrosiozyma monospora TaxID=43982 RepID=A0A9W6Z0W1_AMBMO|nr:unnamed protein product [Ambrosiozyma monospora]
MSDTPLANLNSAGAASGPQLHSLSHLPLLSNPPKNQSHNLSHQIVQQAAIMPSYNPLLQPNNPIAIPKPHQLPHLGPVPVIPTTTTTPTTITTSPTSPGIPPPTGSVGPAQTQQQPTTTTATTTQTQTNKIDKRSLEYVVRSGLAGGIAGMSAKTLIAPLDRVKILFQTSNPQYKQFSGSFRGMFRAIDSIYSTDGIRGLYQGHSATIMRIFPYAAIKFVCYEQIRTLLIPKDEYETAARRFMAGSLAGVLSVSFTYPLDLIRVRLAFDTTTRQQKGKLFNILKTIYHEQPRFTFNTGGVLRNEPLPTRILYSMFGFTLQPIQALSNFYRGFIPTIAGMVPYAGVSFYSHDLLHDVFRSPKLAKYTVQHYNHNHDVRKTKSDSSFDTRKPLKTWAQLVAGGGAGMLAQAAAYPLEVVRRRMQVGAVLNNGGEFLGAARVAAIIYAENGIKGFYVGLGIGFIKIVPMFACSFYVYERTKNWLLI